ncbi:MoaD/ThiS family protein [Ammoniphilus sp. CFH 90114]|uniref:MoaD/ThiS family protein n=1 Tax=Ammoniphilus sp. CFH 90114 TaxID=2493665 RepID=UPI00100DFD2D|nr:MoaD/ThiS family protein [Ammoniphilus sp. CFH 90114]RXT04879.1 hypothetical protein EIZ39_19340 [Ammoniphilus sp. CFH 90114]
MRIKVVSFIVGKTELTGEYNLSSTMSIAEFLESLGVSWDNEALVVVNNKIFGGQYQLKDGDEIHLLTPILGG